VPSATPTCPAAQATIASSKLPPPSRGSPEVAITSIDSGSTTMIETSKVPPPRSYTR
jgi:hypothetical protein